jgi:hypothetical protein
MADLRAWPSKAPLTGEALETMGVVERDSW